MKKRALSIILVILVLCAHTGVIFGAAQATDAPKNAKSIVFKLDSETTWIDNSQLELLEQPQFVNGRTMTPFRILAESIGCGVTWISETREIVVSKGDLTLKYKIDSTDIYKYTPAGYVFYYRMDTTPVLSVKGNTLLPARYVADNFGYLADWADLYNCAVIYPQSTYDLSFDQRKAFITDIITPAVPTANADDFKIDEQRFAQSILDYINKLLGNEGKRALVMDDDLTKVANFRVYESFKFNHWEKGDSVNYAKDREKLFSKTIGKYYVPNIEFLPHSSPIAANIANSIKSNPSDWAEFKNDSYSYIGIGLVKSNDAYRPVIILGGRAAYLAD